MIRPKNCLGGVLEKQKKQRKKQRRKKEEETSRMQPKKIEGRKMEGDIHSKKTTARCLGGEVGIGFMGWGYPERQAKKEVFYSHNFCTLLHRMLEESPDCQPTLTSGSFASKFT